MSENIITPFTPEPIVRTDNIEEDHEDALHEEHWRTYCDDCGCLWSEHDIEEDWESGVREAVCPDCEKCGDNMIDHIRDGHDIICPKDNK